MALNPTRSITGAMVSVFAVSMPSAAHVLWLPSRREVSTRATSATVPPSPDPQQYLPVFDRRAILNEDLGDGAAHLGAHAVHQLHHLNHADDGVLLYLGADLDIRRSAGPRCAVEDSEKRRSDVEERAIAGGCLGLAVRLELRRHSRRRRRRDASPRRRSARRRRDIGPLAPGSRAAPEREL